MKSKTLAARIPTLLTLAFFCGSIANAEEVDWGKIEGKTIKVFYPGASTWEFIRGKDHGTGAAVVKKNRKSCAKCHISKTGKYDINADKIISGELKMAKSKKPFESSPIPGQKGFKDVALQIAFDAENIHMRFQWQGSGASIADPAVAKDGRADRLSVQISDNIKSFRNYGCFITCHDDQTGMPNNRGEEVTLYGYYTRSKGKLKPQGKLDEYLEKSQFIDLWVVAFEGNQVTSADQYVLQGRIDDHNDLSVTGDYKEGKYTAVITRKLSTGDPRDIAIKDGSAFNIAIAIHDNRNKGRMHYSSFPVSIGLSTSADITAQKF